MFCIGNCNIVFLLLNDRYTILRQDSNPPKQSEDCYQSTPLPPSHHGWVFRKIFIRSTFSDFGQTEFKSYSMDHSWLTINNNIIAILEIFLNYEKHFQRNWKQDFDICGHNSSSFGWSSDENTNHEGIPLLQGFWRWQNVTCLLFWISIMISWVEIHQLWHSAF